MYFVLFWCSAVLSVGALVESITLRQECPLGEVHRSCSFNTEYTCWTNAERLDRVTDISKRLLHCRTGCFCKQGLVRAFPAGPCIAAAGCRDRKLQAVVKKIPVIDVWIL